ncbi:MAG: putative acyl-CoA dehydrogenase [Acidimicrobiales bacterium]|jgi:acyl-CoA dehydrogenase|nr:putative acyl-CoA dehydrogenase [Acidimicrobiales bacterium]
MAAADADTVQRARHIGESIAEKASAEVDRDARFPTEAVDALRSDGLLSTLVPTHLGGAAVPFSEVAAAVTALGRYCASTAMVYAMHQIQVACLVRHGDTPFLRDYLRDLADRQLLLASATTEVGIGGDVRTSGCAVEAAGARFRLEKQAGVISYGQNADGVLTTARRTPNSAPNDQVLVLCRRPATTLEPTTGWDTLGFRGTCSLGFRLTASDDLDCVLPAPFADISSQTMLPVSHILWSSVWLGLAAAAVDKARRYVRAEARKKPGTTPPSALRLAELMPILQQMEDSVTGAAGRFDEAGGDRDAVGSLGFAIAMNALKVSASTLVVDIVGRAMAICGMAGYREDSEFSLGRILRDAHGAALMINNDRINANSAQMLLIHRGQ